MNLVWHIVRKDLCRLWVPLAAWLAFVGLAGTGFARLEIAVPEGVEAWPVAAQMLGFHGLLGEIARAIQLLVGAVLTACLVQEDPLPGTDGFWLTRPIGAARLLAAKVLGVILAILIAPAVVLVPAWLVAGFSGAEIVEAAWGVVRAQAGPAWLAFVVAALSGNLGRFLFTALAVGLVAFIALAETFRHPWLDVLGADGAARGVRDWLLVGLVVAGGTLVIGIQFLSRRTRMATWVLALALAAMGLIRIGWVWGLPEVPPATQDSLTIVLKEIRLPIQDDRPGHIVVQVKAPSSDRTTIAYVGFGRLSWSDGTRENIVFGGDGNWSGPEVWRLAGDGRVKTPGEWWLGFDPSPELRRKLRENPAQFQGAIRLIEADVRSLGDAPVRAGAEIRAGATRTRVVDVREKEGRTTLVCEERDSWRTWRDRPPRRSMQRATPLSRRTVEDRFLLAGPEAGRVRDLPVKALATVNDSMLFAAWPATFDGSGSEGLRLVRVRFEKRRYFDLQVAADRLQISEEATP